MIYAPCISIPSKRTDEVDWTAPLKEYITAKYQDDPEKYLTEVNTINQLRQDMRFSGKDIAGRDVLYRYYGQLELLDLRFPINENNIKITFTWYDTFTGKSTSQFSLAYEKACTIFNMASTLSAIASSQVRSEPESMNQALNYFQASAGMFIYINENFLHAPSTDLSQDIVQILSQLMLSQAQECFIEKSIGEKKKDSLIADLANQASWSYGSIVEALNKGVAKTALSRGWYVICQTKQKYYQAVGQFHKALACEIDSKYGEMIARLSYAGIIVKEATRLIDIPASASTPLISDVEIALRNIVHITQDMITEKLALAVKNNDEVYHDTVPDVNLLPPIDKLSAVKAIPISELYGPNEIQKVIGVDIFQRLVPLSVHESSYLYSEEKSKIVLSETEQADLADNELQAALSFMQLPESLEKFKSRSSTGEHPIHTFTQITPEVKEWAKKIGQEENERNMVNHLIITMEGLQGKAKELLRGVDITLDREQRESEAMRIKFGDLWTQPPLDTLTVSFRQDIHTYRESLDKSLASDTTLISRFEAIHHYIDALREGEYSDKLKQMFHEAIVGVAESDQNDGSTSNNDIVESIIKKIEESIEKLNKFKKERREIVENLKIKVQKDDISHLLILHMKSPNTKSQLFTSELEKFKDHQNRIATTIRLQQATIQELSGLFKTLMESAEAKRVQRTWDNAETKRDEIADKLRIAANDYLDIKDGVRKSVQSYVDLNGLMLGLYNNVTTLVHDREQNRQSLILSIDQSQKERGCVSLQHIERSEHLHRDQGQLHIENALLNPVATNIYYDKVIEDLTIQANHLHINNEEDQASNTLSNLPAPAPFNQIPTRYDQADYPAGTPVLSPSPNAEQANCKPHYGLDKEQESMYYPPPQNAPVHMARSPSYGSETNQHN
ncbi:bck1-like resistance to osmotic shock [Basidiobolus ranarum]|uniref:BRO domain-containing protein 1 n=1 Tax=Basidiobolus ranarum TaxID=34480 RepID=A0ABR2WUF4_9FUNG